jgi:hypothetical protein
MPRRGEDGPDRDRLALRFGAIQEVCVSRLHHGERKKPRVRWLLTAQGKMSLLFGRSTYLEIVTCTGMIFAAVLSVK